MTLQLTQFDGATDADRLRACYEIVLAGWPEDNPNEPPDSLESFSIHWAHSLDDEPQETWLACTDDGKPAGCYLLHMPLKRNAEIGRVWLFVDPGVRRAGLGTELLRHCANRARLAGRSRLRSDARDGSPGAAFAKAKGASGGIDEVTRRLDIDESLQARLAELAAAALPRATGYELLSWTGATPEEHLEQLARVRNAMADAPRDAGVQPRQWDAAAIREFDGMILGPGMRFYGVAARHLASGELVAITQMVVDPAQPDWAFQNVTAVVPAHRGHRLGLLVKIAMLDLLAEHEPAVRHCYTGNAGLNAHMIAINEQLGFSISDVYRAWELDLDVAAKPES
jgi:GNAT superfamily N-acetyltransferase